MRNKINDGRVINVRTSDKAVFSSGDLVVISAGAGNTLPPTGPVLCGVAVGNTEGEYTTVEIKGLFNLPVYVGATLSPGENLFITDMGTPNMLFLCSNDMNTYSVVDTANAFYVGDTVITVQNGPTEVTVPVLLI